MIFKIRGQMVLSRGTYEAVVTFKGKAEGLKQITEKKTFQVK